ncbi:hypothetical protein COHA_006904 [Chlorella ohadii]|uniref:Uncharacterized protein n=1 Tax=Chlorella ohadii TaxID=2649997 RepID=A0AAD5DN62_9CHLO|nr:hypothetical protein COHA_006904 [Chlorella ohadii]
MAWDVCYRWQVLHDQTGKRAGFNFPDAGWEADDKLTALLQSVTTVQAAASLARKELLVPPPLPDDKRRALSKKGGEAPRLADIGVRPRPSSRFMLAADHVLKLHLNGDVFTRRRLLFKDHFFDHVWGGSKPGAASGSGSAAGSSRQQQQGPAEEGEDEEEQEEDEESSEEESSDDEGAAARHARKPRPAALWLTTPNGQELAIGFNRAGKDGWSLKWAELAELLELLEVTQANVEQSTLVLTPPASAASSSSSSSSAARRKGFLQAAVRLEVKAEAQQAAAGEGEAAAAAAAAVGDEGEGAAAAEADQEGAAPAAAAAGAAPVSADAAAMGGEAADTEKELNEMGLKEGVDYHLVIVGEVPAGPAPNSTVPWAITSTRRGQYVPDDCEY